MTLPSLQLPNSMPTINLRMNDNYQENKTCLLSCIQDQLKWYIKFSRLQISIYTVGLPNQILLLILMSYITRSSTHILEPSLFHFEKRNSTIVEAVHSLVHKKFLVHIRAVGDHLCSEVPSPSKISLQLSIHIF